MRLDPLFRHFGSKYLASKAGRYPAPAFGAVFEPFAGSACYALCHADRQVWVNETDPHLSPLWQWLIAEANESNVREIPCGVPEGTDIRTLGLTAGQALLLKHWQRTNNVGNCWTVSAWGSAPSFWTENARARVAEQVGEIKHWQFGGYPEDADLATIYVDPPYQYNYRYRSDPIDYVWLGQYCKDLEAIGHQVIVCEALGKNGERPTWLPFRDSHRQVTSGKRKDTQSHRSFELIYP